MAAQSAWAQLVCTTDAVSDPISISKEKFIIGRAKSCDLCISSNKLMSGQHCFIERDADGRVWLQDTSTNGTLLNGKVKVSSGLRKELQHGDEFHLVFRKKDQTYNVAYLFQDLVQLEREELDATLEYTSSDVELSAAETPGGKKESPDGSPVRRKRTFVDTAETEVQASSPKRTKTESNESQTSTSTAAEQQPEMSSKDSVPSSGASVVPIKSIGSWKSGSTQLEAKPSAAAEDWEEAKEPKSAAEPGKDGIEESLICIICQEILHDCISLQPCMHSFCAGCYSDWIDRSNECPSCRMTVDRINKNHLVNNLVEAYLLQHPEKRRPEEDLKELDKKNKITKDMLYPKKKRRHVDDGSDSDDYSDEDHGDSSMSSEGDCNTSSTANPFGLITTPIFAFSVYRPPKTVCRQCPEYKEPVTKKPSTATTVSAATVATAGSSLTTDVGGRGATAGTSGGGEPQPSTSGESKTNENAASTPDYPKYVCGQNQQHVLCQCCLQPMPDRRTEANSTGSKLPPMQCCVCYRSFCHAYWGCRKAGCLGCIAKFKDLDFGKKALESIILENPFESEIFKNYLEENEIPLKDVLDSCLNKLGKGEYFCRDKFGHGLNAESHLCYTCGLKNFRDLAYHYRKDIPADKFPDSVTKRPDCYWGQNCRTQRNKPHHAMRFNHICDQTRTS